MHLDLTQAELTAGVHDTNKRWATTNGSSRLTTSPSTGLALPERLPEQQVLRLPEPAGPLHLDLHTADLATVDLHVADLPAVPGAVDLKQSSRTVAGAAPTQRAGS